MSKPKIFSQMEQSGSFWITKDNWRKLSGNDIKAYYDKNIPVYINGNFGGSTDTSKYLINNITTNGSQGLLMYGSCIKDGEVKCITLKFYDATIHMDDATSTSYTITDKTGDTMLGSLKAKAGIDNARQMRNITLATTEPTSGEVGDIWIQYEE